jgi:hypothetical protein
MSLSAQEVFEKVSRGEMTPRQGAEMLMTMERRAVRGAKVCVLCTIVSMAALGVSIANHPGPIHDAMVHMLSAKPEGGR